MGAGTGKQAGVVVKASKPKTETKKPAKPPAKKAAAVKKPAKKAAAKARR